MVEAGGEEGGFDLFFGVSVEELGFGERAVRPAGGVADLRVLEEVHEGHGAGDDGEDAHGDERAAVADEQSDEQERPTITPEDDEGIPRGEPTEFAVAMLQRVSGEPPRAGDVEEALAVVDLAGEFDGGFAR